MSIFLESLGKVTQSCRIQWVWREYKSGYLGLCCIDLFFMSYIKPFEVNYVIIAVESCFTNKLALPLPFLIFYLVPQLFGIAVLNCCGDSLTSIMHTFSGIRL